MSTRIESPFARAMVAGAIAGTSVDLSLYPIDTLKTRLQSSQGFKAAGGFRGVYAGIGSVALGAAPGAALFFVTYESVKSALRTERQLRFQHDQQKSQLLEPLEHMAAASAGEIAACAIRVPTEVVKQRAQAFQYKGSLAALNAILKQRTTIGLPGVFRELYRGWTITIMREVPFTVIQFPLWEGMKEWRRRTSGSSRISAAQSALFGSVAGAVAAGVTTPLDVLKTRMMLATEKQKMWRLFLQIMQETGPKAFFSGVTPRVLWISLGGAVFLGSYQLAVNSLGGI